MKIPKPESQNSRSLNAFLNIPAVKAGFSLKKKGHSHGPFAELNLGVFNGDDITGVKKNWNSLLAEKNLKAEHLRFLKQIHSNKVVKAGDWEFSNPPEGDALWTQNPKLTLATLGADCLPILLYCSDPQIIAVAHAGWKGSQQKILSTLIKTLQESVSLSPKNTHLCFGPSLQPCHFEVGKEFYTLFPEEVLLEREGKLYLNNSLANKIEAESMGIPPSQIDIFSQCTYCDEEHFFSYRRDKEPTGRTSGFITLAL